MTKTTDFLKGFEKWLVDQDLSRNSVLAYVSSCRCFLDDTEYNPDFVTAEDVDQYLHAKQQDLKPASQNRNKHALNKLLEYLGVDGKIGFVAEKIVRERAPIPEKQDIEFLIRLARKKDPGFLGARNSLIISILYHAGLRIDEAYKINMFEINFTKQEILIPKSKNGESRIVPISARLMDDILYYLRFRQSIETANTALFVGKGKNQTGGDLSYGAFRQIIYKILNAAGMTHLSPYCFRHAFATNLVMGGVSIDAVARLMGHKNIRSIFDYVVPVGMPDAEAVEVL